MWVFHNWLLQGFKHHMASISVPTCSSELVAELHKPLSSMILAARFRNPICLVATVCLLVMIALLYRWGDVFLRLNADPVSEVKVYPAVPAGSLGERDKQQDEKLLRHGQLPQEVIDGVEKFVFFIGWPRSGHSIVGSLMDAHPNVVIANEWAIFRQLMRNNTKATKDAIFNTLYKKSAYDFNVIRATRKKGYTLGIEGYWQGKFTTLKVIGDKKGEDAVGGYSQSPENFTKLYRHISADVLQIPVRVMQVIRNPYDMIATQVIYRHFNSPEWKTNASVYTEDNKCKVHRSHVSEVIRTAHTIQKIRKDLNLTVLEIHSADLVRKPRQTMERICQFLNVECYEEYLDKCVEKVFGKVSITRNLVEWTSDLLAKVENAIKDYSFFQRYTFYSD